MNFNYHEQEYEEFPNFKGGEKSLYAKMFHDEKNRIIYGKLIPGASIGVHTHDARAAGAGVLHRPAHPRD